MTKIKVSTVLNSVNDGITKFEGIGILKNKKIIFFENNIKVIIAFDSNNLTVNRVSDEYTILLQFENSLTKDGNYDIKCDSIQIPIKTSTSVLKILDNTIHVEYELELGGVSNGKFIYDIDYEVV